MHLDKETAHMLDKTLLRFMGDEPLYKSALHKEFGGQEKYNDSEEYHLTINSLNLLTGEQILAFEGNGDARYWFLTPKGLGAMWLLERHKNGFVKEQERQEGNLRIRDNTYRLIKWTIIVSIIGVLASIIPPLLCNQQKDSPEEADIQTKSNEQSRNDLLIPNLKIEQDSISKTQMQSKTNGDSTLSLPNVKENEKE